MAVQRVLVILIIASAALVIVVSSQDSSDYTRNSGRTASRDWGPWTGWSVCSESCGYGTSYRIRRCHAQYRTGDNSACSGPAKQYKICIERNCTNNAADYRARECTKHNEVYYGQQRYSWVPYINNAAPCELSCKSQGYGYYARFKKTVQNFVICNEENTAMCIEGECVSSGCDGVLGSGTKLDQCGVCGGDGTTCRVIQGIFTRTHLTHRGYNVITTIPPGAHSVNITEMSRSNNHLALSTPHGYFLNGNMRLDSEGLVKGAGTTFTYSRATGPSCPGECLTAPGPLNTTLRVELIYFARNPGIMYHYTVPREETRDVISSMASAGDKTPPSASLHPSSRTREDREGHQRDSDLRLPHVDVIPRIRYGQSPVYVPDTDDKPYQNQRLRISSRVSSSRSASNNRPSNIVSRNYDRHDSRYDTSRPRQTAAQTSDTSSYRSSTRDRSEARDTYGRHHDEHDRNKTRHRHRHDRTRAPMTEDPRSREVVYEPTKGQFYLKGENGTIEYKHYYHTNVHDDLGDEPMAAPLEDNSRETGGPRRVSGPTWLNSQDVYDNRYAEFRATTLIQPASRSSLPNIISATASDHQGVVPAPPRSRGVSTQRTTYEGYDNRVSSQDDRRLYSWRILGFTPCSEPCGGGLQETRVVCVKGDSQVEVIEENCDPNLKPASTTIVCNNQPCKASWELSEWEPCSVTCGRGLQKRTVECKQRISPTLTIPVPASTCPQPQPQSRQYCQLDPCFTWRASEWDKCSSECGFGQRSRSISCVDPNGEVVEERLCTQVKPSTEEICDMGSCAQGWFHTRWSKTCSAECGRGHYTRQVYCSAADGSRLDEKKCGGRKKKPKERKSCKATKPCGGQWFTGPWSQCNSTCGSDAYRVRDVLCIKRHGKRVNQVVKEHNCVKEDKPAHTEPCGPLPACEAEWYMTSWSECSRSCGTGVQTREVKCLDASLTASPDCSKDKKPSRRKPCNTQHCSGSREKYAAFSETPIAMTNNEAPRPTTNEALQMDGSSRVHHHSECKDTQSLRWCLMAKQARLCHYYKTICCHTCRKLDPKPH